MSVSDQRRPVGPQPYDRVVKGPDGYLSDGVEGGRCWAREQRKAARFTMHDARDLAYAWRVYIGGKRVRVVRLVKARAASGEKEGT